MFCVQVDCERRHVLSLRELYSYTIVSVFPSGTEKRIKLRTASIPGMTDLTEGLVSSLVHFVLFTIRLI